MATVFSKAELPHYVSTRDTRDRLDLVKGEPVEGRHLRLDRIVYHPGDDCSKHYHDDSYHLFYMLYGEGKAYIDGVEYQLRPGVMLVCEPGELHWFVNDTDRDFAFLEYWAPPTKIGRSFTDDR